MSNQGKIVVKKRIPKIEKADSIQQNNGRMMQRKKKGRLYSLGGNEPAKKPRGRLDRLKTVGTFDLGTEMSVLSEVARNLNEKIISGDILNGSMTSSTTASNRRLSTIPAVSSNLQDLTELSTPSSGRREPIHKMKRNLNKLAANRNTSCTTTVVNFDQFKSDLRNIKTTTFQTAGIVRTQHSADDCLEKKLRSSNNKSRSLSTSSYTTTTPANHNDIELKHTAQINLLNNTNSGKLVIRQQQEQQQVTTNLDESTELKDKYSTKIVNISINDSNKIITDVDILTQTIDEHTNAPKQNEPNDNDSDKIELDMRSAEDLSKRDEVATAEEEQTTFQQRSTRKPVLRKSKRIVRSDSEIFDETIMCTKNEIILQANYDIQIHKEPDYDDTEQTAATPTTTTGRNRSSATSTSTTNNSRKESSDIDEICSPKDLLHKSTDDSSRNMSTDELDTVFSDTTDLEQLEREYRELVRSNLQREYKSDGDGLDEVGKKRNDFLKWKNQSFENNFELYNETECPKRHSNILPEVCSPESHITTTSSETSSNRHYDGNTHFIFKTKPILKSHTSKESAANNSTVTSPTVIACSSITSSTNKLETIRPSKLEITQNVATSATAKEGTITSLFEKRFGKIKKINKLLKCKRFSTSALYDNKSKCDSMESTKSPQQNVEKPSACKTLKQAFSPGKSSASESKTSIYSSKISLFNCKPGKTSIFSMRKSPMFTNTSHSNSELNVEPQSVRTKLNELSKSNTELNKCKSSPSRFGSKRSIKGSKNNSAVCLYKQPHHSPLSEEFYNKTGSVRLSAMELYEKFCSEDFGGLYKHEKTNEGGSCGGYKNWHEYRLGQRGLGVSQKYARAKNAKLLRQKSEPKFSFRDDTSGGPSYFPEEDDEDIYEEEDQREQDEYYDDEYGDEYEDEEGDYYEDEELEEEEEGEEHDEAEEEEYVDEEEAVLEVKCIADTLKKTEDESDTIDDYEVKAYHSEIIDDNHGDSSATASIANDSDVDEIFLMPVGSKCPDDYEEYGFENKKFTLEHMLRASSIEANIDHIEDHTQDVREIDDFGSDEILTIYKICSKDDILNMKDALICKENFIPTIDDEPIASCSSVQTPVMEYRAFVPQELVEQTVYKTDCLSVTQIVTRTESIELLSSSSGTLRSGSTLTEYAFDTVRNLNLDSCSTSKLSLSLKSEIFDDFTLTPDEPKVLRNCDFEDFTLTPDASVCEEVRRSRNASLDDDQAKAEQSITSNDVIMIVDKFLANERQSDNIVQQLRRKDTNIFNFNTNEILDSEINEQQLSIIDIDEEPMKEIISAFTTEITKEFDLLFTRAKLDQHEENDTDNLPSNSQMNSTVSLHSPKQIVNPPVKSPSVQRMPSRYSMQRLEPYYIAETTENGIKLKSVTDLDVVPNSINSEYCKVLDVHDSSFIHKKVITKLKKNRSQSLGNLNNKTRCFPL